MLQTHFYKYSEAYRLLLAKSIRSSYPHAPPPILPPTLILAIRPISQWLCTAAPVGISHEERDGFPPSPQRTLSQTWPLSPPDLTLKWACKEYVLEHREKTTTLKTPRRGNKNPYAHLITAAVSVFNSQLSHSLFHKAPLNDKLHYLARVFIHRPLFFFFFF